MYSLENLRKHYIEDKPLMFDDIEQAKQYIDANASYYILEYWKRCFNSNEALYDYFIKETVN